jgi:hypothetical protein
MKRDKQRCPICRKNVRADERYPRYVCEDCFATATSADGRSLSFGNVDFSGGCVAQYVDTGEEYSGHECFIAGVKCHAGEARFGGIVIEPSLLTVDELLLPFAKSICVKTTAYKTLKGNLTASQRARMLEAISDDIKKCTNFVLPKVSRAACDEAARLGIDLCSKNWHDQPRFDRGRKIFHWEHFVPVADIRTKCIDSCSESEILEILKSRLCVVWILKSEDEELRRLGYRSIRPDPETAYREAKIELIQLGLSSDAL